MTPRIAFVVPLLLIACNGQARREAASLVEAVAHFRRVPNDEKPVAVEGLRAVPCSEPSVCRTRDACLAFAEPTARAIRLKREIELTLAAIEQGVLPKSSPEAQGLAGKLEEAETLLREAQTRLDPCDEAVLALKRQTRL